MELKDATSYGVEIPGTDGRAGMLAIPAKTESEVDFDKLERGLNEKLPAYARPLFIRLVQEADLTSKQDGNWHCCSGIYCVNLFISRFRYLQIKEKCSPRCWVQCTHFKRPIVLQRPNYLKLCSAHGKTLCSNNGRNYQTLNKYIEETLYYARFLHFIH